VSVTATAEPMLEMELWLSFVSLLRSYAAAASLHAGDVRVSSSANTVKITSGAGELNLHFDSESRQGSWTQCTASSPAVTGNFAMQPEGTIHIDGVTKDLDHAAIDFIASISERGKGSRV
jgi:hypothetical protein